MIAEIILSISLVLIIYPYAGYPLLLFILSLIHQKPVKKAKITPSVTLIIAAYNEEEAIEEKIKNSLSSEYDKDKLEIIVASDCSNDGTDEIVKKYEPDGIKLVRLDRRGGKTAVQNLAAKEAMGEILVFSDATTRYAPHTLRKLIRNFNDGTIGCVGGRLIFEKEAKATPEKNELTVKNIDERYEQFIKLKEGQIHTIFGVDGCIYAARKDLYKPLDEHLVSDLALPLTIIEKGYRVIHEPEALAFELYPPTAKDELGRKIRTVSAGFVCLFSMRQLLNPIKWRLVSLGLISHKLLRWAVSLFLITAFISNLLLFGNHPLYNLLFLLQVSFYIFAFLGYLLKNKRKKIKIFAVCLYFCVLHLAALLGFVKFLGGKKGEIWETKRA